MLKALFRTRLAALASWLTGSSRTKKAQGKGRLIGFSLLMLYALGALGLLFWQIFGGVALPFHAAGLDWLYFALTALMSFALMFVGSVFTAKAQLYEARDNDLLLSMPIRPLYILLSRMFMLGLLSFVFGLIPAVPALLVWSRAVGFTGAWLAAYILIFAVLLPLFALAVSALFGWLLSVITARFGNKSLLSVALSLVFLGLYMYGAFRMNYLVSELAQHPEGAAGALGAVAPLYWAGLAASTGDIGALLKTALLMAGSFVLAYALLSATFIRMATDRRSGAKKKYVERAEDAVSPSKALLRRELGRFLSSSAYMLNCGLGAVMALIGAAALVIKRSALLPLLAYDGMAELLPLLILGGLCFTAAMVLVSAPSVSLEGKNLWIAQSLPVETREILRAKLRLHNLVGVPPILIASAVVAAALGLRGITLVCMLALPAAVCVFSGLLGLAENLRHPNFDWINETQAVKSGLGVLFTMLIGWGIMAVPVLCIVFFGAVLSPPLICAGFLLLLLALCALLYRWLMTRGAGIYRSL